MIASRAQGVALLFVLLPAACCHVKTQEAPDPSSRSHTERVEIVVPDQERTRANPVSPTPGSVEAGEQVFQSMCTPCHGKKGNGRGPLARALMIRPPDFRSAREQDAKTDGEFFYILTNGHEDMPAQGDRWSDEVKWNVINYIRTLRRCGPGPGAETSAAATAD